jgi:hypothetical protein
MKKRSTAGAPNGKAPKVGLFFLVNRKPWVVGLSWMEVPSEAGFRTYATGHPEYWERLQALGVAPNDMPYEDVPRGRVNYEDATGRFTLMADKCILRNERLVTKIMNNLGLPKNTKVLPDDHYRCPKCLRQETTTMQEKEDWDF